MICVNFNDNTTNYNTNVRQDCDILNQIKYFCQIQHASEVHTLVKLEATSALVAMDVPRL